MIRKLGYAGKIKVLNPSVERRNLYMFVHERHPDLHRMISKTLRGMENNGMLTELRLRVTTRF